MSIKYVGQLYSYGSELAPWRLRRPQITKFRRVLAYDCVAIVVASILGTAAAADDPKVRPFQTSLLNREILDQGSWKDDSLLRDIVASWPRFDGEQGFENKTVVRQSRFLLLDVLLNGEYRVGNTDHAQELFFMPARGQDGPDEEWCGVVESKLVEIFGMPNIISDTSKNNRSWIDRSVEWQGKSGVLRLSCAGVKMYEKYISAVTFLAFFHRDIYPALREPIRLVCDGRKRATGLSDDNVKETSPIHLILDQNAEKVMTISGERLGETEVFEPGLIVLVGETEGSKGEVVPWRFQLDRVAGTYDWKTSRPGTFGHGVHQWGSCRRVSSKPKF